MNISLKKPVSVCLALGMMLSLGGCKSKETIESLERKVDKLEDKVDDLKEENESLALEIEMLQAELELMTGETQSDEDDEFIVGISMPTDDLARWENDGHNIEKAINETGISTDLEYANNEIDVQINQISAMIDGGCDVIIIAAIETAAFNEVLAKAAENGVTIIAYDRPILVTEDVDYYITFDNYLTGALQGQYVVDQLDLNNTDGTYNIEFTAGDPYDNAAKVFYDGAYDVLKPYLDSGRLNVLSGQISFEEVATSRWDTDTARGRAESIIGNYYSEESVDAWICSNDTVALGVATALEELTESFYSGSYPIITGQDCDIANVKNIRDGKQAMSVFKDTAILAEETAEIAIAIGRGESADGFFTTETNNGSKMIPTRLCKPVVVNADNYVEILIDSGYYSEDDLL